MKYIIDVTQIINLQDDALTERKDLTSEYAQRVSDGSTAGTAELLSRLNIVESRIAALSPVTSARREAVNDQDLNLRGEEIRCLLQLKRRELFVRITEIKAAKIKEAIKGDHKELTSLSTAHVITEGQLSLIDEIVNEIGINSNDIAIDNGKTSIMEIAKGITKERLKSELNKVLEEIEELSPLALREGENKGTYPPPFSERLLELEGIADDLRRSIDKIN